MSGFQLTYYVIVLGVGWAMIFLITQGRENWAKVDHIICAHYLIKGFQPQSDQERLVNTCPSRLMIYVKFSNTQLIEVESISKHSKKYK